MTELFTDMNCWHWFIFGGLLLIIEMLVPSTLFLWPGISALIVGVAKLVVPTMGWPVAVAVWAILSVVTVVGWTKYRKANPAPVADNGLNQRGQQYVGQVFVLTKPLENGKGEIKAGDTVWAVTGQDTLPAGTNVRVKGVDGARLSVEKA